MGTGFAKRKKQAKMLQQQLSQMQEELQQKEWVGTAGNGLVQIVIQGSHLVRSVKIDPQCVDREDVEGLELLIKAAIGDVLAQIEQSQQQNMPLGDLPQNFGL